MALQTTGPISANDINLELGRAGTAAFSLGGTEERDLAGVASGLIGFDDFYGKSNAVVYGHDVSLFDTDSVSPYNSFVYFALKTTGIAESQVFHRSPLAANEFTWRLAGASSDYQVRMTHLVNGGGLTGHSAGTWWALSSNRWWQVQATAVGQDRVNLIQLEIKRPADPAALVTFNVSMRARCI